MKPKFLLCFTLLASFQTALASSRELTVRAAYREYISAAVARDPKIARFFSQSFLAQELDSDVSPAEKVCADNLNATRLRLFVGHGIDPALDPVAIKCSGDTCQVQSPDRLEKTGPVTLLLNFVASGSTYLIDDITLDVH